MAPAGAGGDSSGQLTQMLVMFAMVGVIFFFLIYRPQKKRQKEREALINSMEKGDKVITNSGIHGTITAVEDTSVLVQVAENTKIRFEKIAVTSIVKKDDNKSKS